ncbi:MAG: biopolymer transporter ExbD [Pseudomonadota bacterium]
MVLSMTPLIDVVFLLLIFFMLASTFLKFSTMPMVGASGGGGAADLSEIALVQLGAEQEIRVNGQTVPLDALADHVAGLQDSGVKRAVIRSGSGSTVQDIVSVLEIMRSTTLENVSLVK